MSFPTLLRFPFARQPFSGVGGPSLAERWRARLDVEGLEERYTPATHGGLPAPVGIASTAPSNPSSVTNALNPLSKTATPPVLTLASSETLLFLFNRTPIVRVPVPLSPPPLVILPPPGPIRINLYPDGPSAEQTPLELRAVPAQMTMSDGETITFTAKADYGDQPAEHPHFSLEPVEGAQFPEGASIDPETGVFVWEPTPGIYAFRVCVRDGDETASQIVHLRVKEKAATEATAAPVAPQAAIPAPAGETRDEFHTAALGALAACAGLAFLKPRRERGRRLAA